MTDAKEPLEEKPTRVVRTLSCTNHMGDLYALADNRRFFGLGDKVDLLLSPGQEIETLKSSAQAMIQEHQFSTGCPSTPSVTATALTPTRPINVRI